MCLKVSLAGEIAQLACTKEALGWTPVLHRLDITLHPYDPSTRGMEAEDQGHWPYREFVAILSYMRPSLKKGKIKTLPWATNTTTRVTTQEANDEMVETHRTHSALSHTD